MKALWGLLDNSPAGLRASTRSRSPPTRPAELAAWGPRPGSPSPQEQREGCGPRQPPPPPAPPLPRYQRL